MTTEYCLTGAALDADRNEMRIDLSQPRKIRVVGVIETEHGPIEKEYFLKVTERKGLVLV